MRPQNGGHPIRIAPSRTCAAMARSKVGGADGEQLNQADDAYESDPPERSAAARPTGGHSTMNV
jgi:hypothetical protein